MRSAAGQPGSAPRRGPALLLAVLYLLVALVLPGLHVAHHHDDHDHEGGGINHHAPLLAEHAAPDPDHDAGHGHDHDDGDHDHGDDDDDDDSAPHQSDHHGGGSLAHFASAYLPAPLVGAALAARPLDAGALPALPAAQIAGRDADAPPRARGPPPLPPT